MKTSVARVLVAVGIALAYLTATPAETERTGAVALKMVRYRDAVSFPIPAVWKEEDEPGIQGTFYEDAPDTGTLRVSVMQWLGSSEEDRNRIVKSILLPGKIETLKQGVYLKKEVTNGSEGSEPLKLHRWLVVLALPENTCRLVTFTHTISAAQENNPAAAAELATVDFAVRNAVYSYEPELTLVDKP